MKPVSPCIAGDLEAVNRLVIEQLTSRVPLVETIGHHIVDSGGKRLRPQLVLLSARACGYDGDRHIALAAVIEFIHTATLLHDDVVDVSALRRGRPTANATWGNAPSVLVGDFIYSRAFQLLVHLDHPDLMALMADTTNEIAEGEVLQLARAGRLDTTEADYREIIRCKTAVLFQAAMQGGALLAGVDRERQAALARYGLALGLAFQMVDDLLDYTGDPDALGKNLGDDLAEGKMTLPLIHALRHGTPDQQTLLRECITERDTGRMAAVIAAVTDTGGLDYTRQQAGEAGRQALDALAGLPDSEAAQTLRRLAETALARTR